jgi:hypothetical protein
VTSDGSISSPGAIAPAEVLDVVTALVSSCLVENAWA